eukprot:c20456_g1_i1 orf=249-398(-)
MPACFMRTEVIYSCEHLFMPVSNLTTKDVSGADLETLGAIVYIVAVQKN